MNPAIFAKNSYIMTEHGNKQERIDKINKNLEGTGYIAVPENSNRDITYYKNDDAKKVNISARGTDLNNRLKLKQDVNTDLMFGLGKEEHDKHFIKKSNRISDLVKKTPEDYEINLSGHSIGSSVVVNALKTKKNVRDRVNKVHTFNGAVSPFTKKPSKEIKKVLDEKVVNHRINSDVVSSSLAVNGFGKIKTYKPKERVFHKSIPKVFHNVFSSIDQLNHHSINQFI